METHDIHPGDLLSWNCKAGVKILVRVRYLAKDYVAIFVAAATPSQVLECKRNVGEQFAVLANCLEPADPDDYGI